MVSVSRLKDIEMSYYIIEGIGFGRYEEVEFCYILRWVGRCLVFRRFTGIFFVIFLVSIKCEWVVIELWFDKGMVNSSLDF